MKQLVPIGRKQYEKFVKDIQDTQKPSFNKLVTNNKLLLFSRKAKPDQWLAKRKLYSLKDDCKLFQDYLSHVKAEKVTFGVVHTRGNRVKTKNQNHTHFLKDLGQS